MQDPSLPPAKLLQTQAKWLYPARSRLFQRIGIAHKQRVLDLGAGYGAVTGELARRSQGFVAALDQFTESLREISDGVSLFRIGGISSQLPLKSTSFDLVFCQCSLMWMAPIQPTLTEIWRVLSPAGDLVAIEPDYEALIEWPPEITTQHLWLSALERSGADPSIGRKLPVYLTRSGFEVDTYLLDQLTPPSELRFEFLKDLPLTQSETQQLHEIMRVSAELGETQQTIHLPFFLISARKR